MSVQEIRRRYRHVPQYGREVHILRTESGLSEDKVRGHVSVHGLSFGRPGAEFSERPAPRNRQVLHTLESLIRNGCIPTII